jgi:tetratricopeptide (TPR) repeat protein
MADMLVTEGGLDANYERTMAILKDWQPLKPESPSQRERIIAGIRTQTRGKVLKDKGDWESAAKELQDYIDNYAISGSESEGWATGDLAHVLRELGQVQKAEDVLIPQLKKRQASLPESDMASVRKDDMVFLEIQSAECMILREEYDEAEKKLRELKDRFERFSTLNYTERIRFFFILHALARCAQGKMLFKTALDLWAETVEYATAKLDNGVSTGKWGRNSYFIAVALLSMSVCHYELGANEEGKKLGDEAKEALAKTSKMLWWVCLGTAWPNKMKESLHFHELPLRRATVGTGNELHRRSSFFRPFHIRRLATS